MQLVVLGVNHRTAPVTLREKISFSPAQIGEALNRIYEYEEIGEAVLLSTCNRTEIYVMLEDISTPKLYMLDLLAHLKGLDTLPEEMFFCYSGREAMMHLFNVSASLDSLVLGEGQILSQLKIAYITAYSRGLTGTSLNIIFQRAISVGKKVRSQTNIADTPVSVSYTAVNLAEECLPFPFEDAKVLILGAGEMSELTATHLQAKGVKTIFVSNRTYQRAVELAEKFHGQAIHFDSFMEHAKEADILITSTGAPHFIIDREQAAKLMEARQGRPVVMIDIAVPRDIDPEVGYIDGVSLFNIDALENVVEENKQLRAEEAEKAKPLIIEAVDEVEAKLAYMPVRPMMTLLSERAERIRKREVHRAMAKLPDIDEKTFRIMEGMSRMIVRKLLREPMIRFGEIAGTDEEGLYWDLFKDMFDLEKER